MVDQVRSARTERRFFIDNVIIDDYGEKLGAYGIAVYATLCRFANKDRQDCFPAHATIAKRLGISEREVGRKLKQMQEIGLIRWTHRQRKDGGLSSNLYVILDPPTTVSPIPTDRESDDQSYSSNACQSLEPIYDDKSSLPLPSAKKAGKKLAAQEEMDLGMSLGIESRADAMLFVAINRDRKVKGYRKLTKYQSIQQKEQVNEAAKILPWDKLEEVIKAGLQLGITSPGKLASYLAGAAKKHGQPRPGYTQPTETVTRDGKEVQIVRL